MRAPRLAGRLFLSRWDRYLSLQKSLSRVAVVSPFLGVQLDVSGSGVATVEGHR